MALDGTEGQAFERLGQGISQTIMLNTRARLTQAQLARQQYVDEQNVLLKQAQTEHQNQLVMDLMIQQRRAKEAGAALARMTKNPDATPFGESIGSNPAASQRFISGYTLRPGEERRVPTQEAPIVSQQPRPLGVGQILVPNQAGQSGILGSPSGGYYAPQQGTNAPVQIVPPAPHYGTAQGDVERLRAEAEAMRKSSDEIEKLMDSDRPQAEYLLALRKSARERVMQNGQGVLPPSQGTNAPAPVKILSIKQIK